MENADTAHGLWHSIFRFLLSSHENQEWERNVWKGQAPLIFHLPFFILHYI